MKRTLTTLAVLSLGAALAACSPKAAEEKAAEGEAAPAAAAAPAPGGMGGMEMAAAPKMGKGTGSVTAVDAAAGTVKLDHGPIPEVGWPAMSMSFTAASPLLQGVKVGDKVAFDVKVEKGASEITAMTKAPG